MAKERGGAVAPLNTAPMEGHGGDEHQPSVGKGTLTVVGTGVDLAQEPRSPNKKTGRALDEQP